MNGRTKVVRDRDLGPTLAFEDPALVLSAFFPYGPPSTSLQLGSYSRAMLLTHQQNDSIGGLVVKLAVAIRDLQISDDSASPGFDSRPMHLSCLARTSWQSFCSRLLSSFCSIEVRRGWREHALLTERCILKALVVASTSKQSI
jgi:hypothetical protein